jgi:hypothetical protein
MGMFGGEASADSCSLPRRPALRKSGKDACKNSRLASVYSNKNMLCSHNRDNEWWLPGYLVLRHVMSRSGYAPHCSTFSSSNPPHLYCASQLLSTYTSMLPNHDPGVLELKAISSDLFDIAKAHFTYTEEGPCFVGWLSALERAAPYLFMPQQQNAKMTQVIGTALSAAMQFLCAPRSRRERTVMLMKSCRCPYSQRSGQEHKNMEALVSTAPLLRRLPPLVFVERLLKLVEAACDVRFTAIHGRTMRIDRIRKRKTWPRSIQEILPYGPEDTVRGLLGWLPSETCYYGADPASVLRMVHLILRFTRPLTLPYVLTSHTFISKGIQAPLANACKTLESSRRDPEQPDYSAEQEAYDVILAVMDVMDDLVML